MVRTWRFRTKVYVGILSVLLLFGGCVSFFITRIASRYLLNESTKRGTGTAVNLAARVAEPMLALDFLTMKDMVDELLQTSDDWAYGFVLDHKGLPLVHTFSKGFPVDLVGANQVEDDRPCRVQLLTDGSHLFYDFAAPVRVGRVRVGTVRIGMSRDRVQQALRELRLTILYIMGTGLLAAAAVATFLARTVTQRLASLRRSAQQIIRGNLDVQTVGSPVTTCWEIMDCGHEECPAYGDRRRRCWYLAGTLCPTCVEGEFARKIDSCKKCPVYKKISGDELQDLAEYFDYMALTLRDRMEALKETQVRLARQQQVFRTILNVTPDIVCLQDREGRYQAVSKAFCRFFGKTEEEVLGRTDFDLFKREIAEINRREDMEVMEKRQPLQKEKRVKGRHGSRWFHVVKTPVLDDAGQVMGILCNERDITEFKHLQDRMAEAQKLESIGQLAAGIAHEINTPLGIILGHVQLLIEDLPPGSDAHQSLLTVEKHCRICKKIVSDLLRFSRHTESVKKPVDVNELIEHVVSVVAHSYGLDGVAVATHLDPHLPKVYGDPEKLEQVFINLLHNAYQAIGANGRIDVSTRWEDGRVVVDVADTGEGIPPDIRHRIFDPFFTTKGVGKGTGLGLSVTFGIVKDHGGTIDFSTTHVSEVSSESSDRSPGTVFTCRFPAYRESTEEG